MTEATDVHASKEIHIRELHTRFLFPFTFKRNAIREAVSNLEQAMVLTRKNVWRASEPPVLYRDELTRHLDDFLFGARDSDIATASYLCVAKERLQQLLPKGTVVVLANHTDPEQHRNVSQVQHQSHTSLPVSTLHTEGVELFLSNQGVGALSVALVAHDISLATAIDFNYRLALTRRDAAYFYIPHPSDAIETWNKIPESQRACIAPPPTLDSSYERRIGMLGGTFTLNELRHALLSPLFATGLPECSMSRDQRPLSLYSVARFDESVDLAECATKEQVAHFLSAISQIEEPWHAGAVQGEIPVPNQMLNRCHWAAVGFNAACHAVIDQAPPEPELTEHPFNSSRVARVRVKYFTPYLTAELQRIVLHRSLAEASNIASATECTEGAALAKLRGELLEFSLHGQFDQVSYRHAIHRFYRLVQEGFSLEKSWSDLRVVVADLDSRNLTERQERTQHAAHLIEMFVASVYFAHLTEMLLHASDALHDNHGAKVAMISIAALGGLGLAYFLTRRADRRH